MTDVLQALAAASDDQQWLLVCENGSIKCCSGPGPFRSGETLEIRLQGKPQRCRGGWLAMDSAEPASQWDHALVCWIPENLGPHSDGLRKLITSQATLLEQHYQLSVREQTLTTELETARREASHDILTGLYNRRGWGALVEKEEARSRRYDNACSLVVVDLDELKEVNDSQGHRAGDRLIRHAARVIASTTRQPDVVARVGGDEFAVLLVETDKARAAGFINRLTAALDEAQIHASVGFAQWCPEESLCDTLYRADQAMYADKRTRQRGRAG